jgi:glycosyltransferase involved in cell wall biosynthesis
MLNNKKIEIILPAYNEEKSIKNYIQDLESLNIFDKIVVINNNSTDSTRHQVSKTSAVYLEEKKQGFGAAVKKGLNNISSEIVLISEPDGSFLASDILKMFQYIEEYDAIFTTRTNNKMKFYLKFGNKIFGLLVSFLFGGPVLSDAGSSLRLIKSKAIKDVLNNLKYDGPELQMELTISLLKKKFKIKEIEVNYQNRIGRKSVYTKNFLSSFKVLLGFTKVVLLKFFKII